MKRKAKQETPMQDRKICNVILKSDHAERIKMPMKVQELRQRLQAADREHVEKAFVECYKQLRKGQKEELHK